MKKISLIVLASITYSLLVPQVSAAEVSKYGVKVKKCNFDYDGENFCTDERLKNYAKVLKNRKANFDHNKIIYIFETNEEGYRGTKPYRMVVINKDTKLVSPFYFALFEARDEKQNPVNINNKGDTRKYDFNLNSNRFCYTGDIHAYRNAYGYLAGPFCFNFDPKENDMVREYE